MRPDSFTIVFTALCAGAWNFPTLFAARFLAGATAGFCTPQIWASIPLLVPKEHILSVMGTATAGLSVAMIAGVPIGALLTYAGWRMPFLVVSAFSAIVWIILCLKFPHVLPSAGPRTTGSMFAVYGHILRHRPLAISLIAYLIFQTGQFTGFSFIGTWLAHSFHASEGVISGAMMAIGIGQVIGATYGSRITARLGQARSLFVGIVGVGLFYGLCAFAGNVVLGVVFLALAMLCGGFLYPAMMIHLQSHMPAARGTISSLANTAMYIGVTVAGAVGGVLINRFNGFAGISGWVVLTFAASSALYFTAGAFRRVQQ